jgi:hypothetical protein
MKTRFAATGLAGACSLLVLVLSGSVRGQLSLVGGGLTLVQEGPTVANAGDPVPANLAIGATPFSSSDLGPELGIPFHVAANLNDGLYGNSFSWIGGDANPFALPFAGIDLGALTSSVQSIAFGRTNAVADPFVDRHLGLYTLQYTQVADPSTNLGLAITGDPSSGWTDIGTLDYGVSEGLGTNYNETQRRHRFNFDPVDATGIRLVVPATGLGGGTAIDEIELFDVPGDYVPPPPPPDPLQIVSAAGFHIAFDGNNGDHFDPAAPPEGAKVPNNAALAANGATAFSGSDLGPELGIAFHVAANLNDGYYGNANSWIGGAFDGQQFAGVALGQAIDVASIAFGRDNGNLDTDACGGQCTDRSIGFYTLQFTQVDNPDGSTPDTGDAATGWQTLGTIDLKFDTAEFNTYLRHEFQLSADEGPLTATGVRLLVPATGLAGGTAIDEIEVYAVPEPGSWALMSLSGLALFRLRRRAR